MPIAFADIEMIFDEERQAIDWIFRYGNAVFSRIWTENGCEAMNALCFTAKRSSLSISAPKSISICG